MTTTTKHWLRAQLFALAMTSLKVGCQVKSSLRCPRQSHRFRIHAIAGIQGDSTSGQVLFDSVSFPICIDMHTSTNTPIFHMASSSSTYSSFAATFETMEAPFLQRETNLQLPGPWFPREYVIPKEFVAKEDLHQGEKKSVDAANEKDHTDCISNLPSSPVEEDPSDESIRRGSLTVYLNPPEAEKEDSPLSATDDPAVLIRWHYHLGHLTFAKLKQLALNGNILKKLALLNPPKCAGCLLGAMTKIPWHSKESKSPHKVFAAIKPGETVSVNQMVLTKVGVFTKHAFEKFTAKHGVCINHYHCDNGLYADNAFKDFQNGIAIVESEQKQLLHTHALWTAVVHFAPWLYATWNAIRLVFACPAITTATNGDYSLQLIIESFYTGATQVAPATIDMLASEGAALFSEGAQPALTILCNELCEHGLIVDFNPTTSNLLLLPVSNCSATSHLLLPRIHECSAIAITNDPFQLNIISVSEGACAALITFEQSQQPKHDLVDHYGVIGRTDLIDPINFVGFNGQLSLVSLKLINIIGLVKCNGLFDFIGVVGLDRLVGIVNLSCLDDLIGLVNLVKIVKLDIKGRNGLIGRISIVGQVSLVSLVDFGDLAIVLSHPCFGLVGHTVLGLEGSINGLISVLGFVGLVVSFLSLVSLGGLIDHFSLVSRCILGLIELAASSNHWPLGLIGIIILSLIASSATTASLACRLISFVSLVGSLTHRLFHKRLTASVIEATNIGRNGLDHFDGIIGLAGFGLNCLDDFNGIIGLVGFGLISCIGFIVGIIGLIMLAKLVGFAGLFDCIGEPAFDLNFNNRSVVGKLNFLAQTARPDSMYAMHQIAKYSSDPRTSHGEAVLYLIRYLKKTRDLGLLFKPDCNRVFEFYCDADFSGLWNKALAPVDPSTSKSLSGWIIFYAGCPVSWASKLQSQVELSTTKAECIAMSQALKDIIPITG